MGWWSKSVTWVKSGWLLTGCMKIDVRLCLFWTDTRRYCLLEQRLGQKSGEAFVNWVRPKCYPQDVIDEFAPWETKMAKQGSRSGTLHNTTALAASATRLSLSTSYLGVRLAWMPFVLLTVSLCGTLTLMTTPMTRIRWDLDTQTTHFPDRTIKGRLAPLQVIAGSLKSFRNQSLR